MSLSVKIVNRSPYPPPQYATEGAAGADLRANISEAVTLQSLERYHIPTGVFIQLPNGYEAQVRPRSGLALKQGITCLNSPGTIDSDYRGELKIVLVNLSAEAQVIRPGDRVAQLVIQKVERAVWEEVAGLDESPRGVGGFGSTGKQ